MLWTRVLAAITPEPPALHLRNRDRALSAPPYRRYAYTARTAHFCAIWTGDYMNMPTADDPTSASADRVRRSTPEHINRQIDRDTDASIAAVSSRSRQAIEQRMAELDREWDVEWDVERVLEVNASTLALTGLILGTTFNRKWLLLPGIVLPFLLQHGLQGWCPPLPVLRRLGVRTRGEIDREKYALAKALAGSDH
jgi:hypothetical protein